MYYGGGAPPPRPPAYWMPVPMQMPMPMAMPMPMPMQMQMQMPPHQPPQAQSPPPQPLPPQQRQAPFYGGAAAYAAPPQLTAFQHAPAPAQLHRQWPQAPPPPPPQPQALPLSQPQARPPPLPQARPPPQRTALDSVYGAAGAPHFLPSRELPLPLPLQALPPPPSPRPAPSPALAPAPAPAPAPALHTTMLRAPVATPLLTPAPQAPSFTPPMRSVTLLERHVSDIADRYPRLAVPPHFTHALACWPHTLGEAPSVIALGSGAPPPSPDAPTAQLSVLQSALAQCIVLDNERASLAPGDSATASGDPGTSSLMEPPPSVSPESPQLPVRFSVRVMLLAGPESASDASVAMAPSAPCILRELRLLVSKRSDATQLLGGAWDAATDGGDPLLEDACLVRAAVRHCRLQAGLDLEPCARWAKVLQLFFHRPAESPSPASASSSASSELLECVTVLLVLDPQRAARRFLAPATGGGPWEVADEGEGADPDALADSDTRDGLRARPLELAPADVAGLRVDELRAALAARSLYRKGRKDELAARLVAALEAEAGVLAAAERAPVESAGDRPAPSPLAKAAVPGALAPPLEPCLVAVAPPHTQSQSQQHVLVTLDGLLSYRDTDRLERSFEASLVAEALLEQLQREAARTLAQSLGALAKAGEGDASPQRRAHTSDGGGLKRVRTTEQGGAVAAAFRLLDRAGSGAVSAGDLELLLLNGGLRLSRFDARQLVARAFGDAELERSRRLHYADVIERLRRPDVSP